MTTEFLFKNHAIFRMLERNIAEEEVREVSVSGECIETYGDDQPYPSKLMFKIIDGRPLDVVVASVNKDLMVVVTAYIADTTIFNEDFKTRR